MHLIYCTCVAIIITIIVCLKGGLHEIFCVFFLHQLIVHVMCLMFVTFVFENKNNLLVKKRV